MIAKQTVFLIGDRSKAVPEGHEDAKFLLVREGSNIEDALAEKHNAVALIDTPAKKKAAEPQQTPPPNLKGGTDATPADGKTAKVPKVFEKIGKPKRGSKSKK